MGSGRGVEGAMAAEKTTAPAPPATRDFLDFHTGVRHTVSKSKQRLARCRFVMMYSDPVRAPLPSKGLRLARIPGLDQARQPVYGLTESSWMVEIACHQCDQLILNHDRIGGPIRLREARMRRAARSGDQPALLLCAECDPEGAAPLRSSRTSKCGKRRREVLLEPDQPTVSIARRSVPDATSWGGHSQTCYTVSNLDMKGANVQPAGPKSAEIESGFGVNYASDTATTPGCNVVLAPHSTAIAVRPDKQCPFCKNSLQHGEKLGSFWRKFGYQGEFVQAAVDRQRGGGC